MKELTKTSTSAEIKQYFNAILKLSKASEEFPVNLDEVWPLVYAEKGKAVRALEENFIEGVDYQVLAQNGKNPQGGRPANEYSLSVPCMEFFIARKVRDVFEVYRRVFHKTAKAIGSKEKATSARTMQLMRLDTAKWLMKNLNYSDTAKLVLAKAIAEPLDLPTPVYAESKGAIHSAKYHLEVRGIKMSSEKFNKIMVGAGMAERGSRYSRSKKKNVTWQVLCGDGLLYGKNDVHPSDPRETQPNYYDDKFDGLLQALGIAEDNEKKK